VSPAMVVQPPGVWLGAGFIQSQGPSITCNATAQCVIVSGDFTSRSALGRATVTNGTPSVSNTLIDRASSFPAVASFGTSFLVVYNDGITPSVNAVMLDAGGTLASTPNQLTTPSGSMQAATATGTGYLAAWQLGSIIEYSVIDPGGVPLGPNQRVPGPNNSTPSAASSPTVSLLVWNELGSHVRATRITSDGTQLDVPPLSITQASTAARPTVTWDGVTFLVAWERKIDLMTASLAAAAIDPDTGAIGPETELTPAASPVTDTVPACASEGAGTSLCVFQRTIVSQLIFGIVIKR
jgi:hypothetical protein